jgi:protein O-mannosyl-transferase
LILLAAVLVYSNSYTGLFVFDDEPAIVENPHIKQLWPLTAAMRAPAGTTVSGRPIVSLSLAINYALAPDFARDTLAMPAPGAPASEYDRLYANLWGYHAFNLAIHIAAALTLFGVVRRTLLTDRLRPQFGEHATALALIVALIWTVHPLQTSAVTYIIQRAESLMALFYLLTLYCAIRALEGKRATLWTVASAFACALGMMSKESMVSAPLVVLMWGWLFGSGVRRGSDGGQTGVRRGSDEGQTGVRRGSDGGQTRVRPASDPGPVASPPGRLALYTLLAATWVVLAVLVAGGHRPHAAGFGFAEWPWWRYLMTQAQVVTHYLRLAFVPAPLVLDYAWPPVQTVREVLLPVLLLTVLLAVGVWALARQRPVALPTLAFFLILAPTSSVYPIVTEVAAEHRMYLPLACVVAVVVAIAYGLLRPRGRIAMGAGAVLAAGVVYLFGAMTYARNADYQGYERIWLDTIDKRPGNARARNNYATALVAQGRFGEAEEELRRAVEIDPKMAEAWGTLGVALCAQGRCDEGIESLNRAVALAPESADLHFNLGEANASRGDMRAALAEYDRALAAHPDDVKVLNRVGWILATDPDPPTRNGARAVSLSEHAVALTRRRDVESLDTLAAAYAEVGRYDAAVAAANEAMALAPSQEPAIIPELQERLLLYKVQRPFRQAGRK